MPKVVTCLLIDDNRKLLILKRSDKVRTYKGQWGGVAGYVEEGESPEDTAYKELNEELGLIKKDVHLISKLEPFRFTDIYGNERYNWEVFVFLFKTKIAGKVKIDWEHVDYKWIQPLDVGNYDTVPYFRDVVLKVLLK